jgi:lipopolysaccharide export system permease protein
MTRIWERYFTFELLKLLSLFLITFYLLYVAIDYSSRSPEFTRKEMTLAQISLYYLLHFVQQLDILLPFALMCATLRTVCSLNVNNELVALIASGISLKRITRPFVLIALASVALLYVHFEWARPKAITELKKLGMTPIQYANTNPAGPSAASYIAEDGSRLLYQDYDSSRERFFDLYWIRSGQEIYRCQYLYPDRTHSIGTMVDHLVRNSEGEMEFVASYNSKVFEELGFTDDRMGKILSTPKELSISALWAEYPSRGKRLTDRNILVMSKLHHHLAFPWMALLVVIAPLSFCLRFTRHLHIFLLYGASVVAFLIFMTILQTFLVLAENQVIPPQAGSWAPFLLSYMTALWYYFRMK